MEEYKPNSHKSKEEQKNLVPEKRVEKVISGTVKSKKKSEYQLEKAEESHEGKHKKHE